MPSSTMLDAALSYLRRGWTIIPAHTGELGICSCRNPDCTDQGKHPRVKWTDYQVNPPDEAQLRIWWGRWPDANVAIITGETSNVAGIDVDFRHGGDESIRKWEPSLPATAQSITGGGGEHRLYAHPGVRVPSVTDVLPGVDIRADGGILILPPSVHSSGRTYEWDTSSHPDDIAELPLLPAFVVDAANAVSSSAVPSPDRTLNLDAVMEGTQRVPEGLRNATMARLYGSLIHTVEDAEAAAQMFNEQSFDPPLPERELDKIIHSINRRETHKQNEVAAVEAAIESGEPSEEDRLGMVNKMWGSIGLSVVADWICLTGDVLEYLVVTPDVEVRLGSNLLDYRAVRTAVFNQAKTLMEPLSAKQWEPTARILRQLVREQVVEQTSAKGRVDIWFA